MGIGLTGDAKRVLFAILQVFKSGEHQIEPYSVVKLDEVG